MSKKIFLKGELVFFIMVSYLLIGCGKVASAPAEVKSPQQKQAQELYQEAAKLKSRKPVEAREAYKEIIDTYPDVENIVEIQQELHDLNMDIILSNRPVEGKTIIHEVASGDTLGKIAKKYGVTVGLIQKSNGFTNDIIRVGQKIRIWQGDFNAFVDKSQNILILKDGNEVVKIYSVATGVNNSTPVGEFTIVSRLVDPVWFNRGVVVPPESPQNELGTRWLGFNIDGYGIHGTPRPESIGQQVTAGCVRMRNEEVEELYDFFIMGAKVVVVD